MTKTLAKYVKKKTFSYFGENGAKPKIAGLF